MQPQTLTLKAFGPYMDETVDFSSFYGNNIFLIAGKTGSGKTTLFDGICFALFGKTNGSNREPKEMRSTFANSKEETSVSFTFLSQNKQYEITRSPAQTLLKLKGGGTREVPSKASIRIFNDDGKELQHFTKISEVDSVIEEVVQLNSDQFRQIVMIPQGEFRRFLNADSGDKEVILRKLFGTDIYRQFSEQLKEEKKKASAQLSGKEKQLETTLSKAHWNSNKPEIEVAGFAGLKEEWTLLKGEHQQMEQQLQKRKAELEKLDKETNQADQFLKDQQTIQTLLNEQKELEEERQYLEKKQMDMEKIRQSIKTYEQAEGFETLLNKIKDVERDLNESLRKEDSFVEQLTKAKETLQKQKEVKQQFEQEQPEQRKRKERLMKLNHLKESIDQYQESSIQNQEQEVKVNALQQEKEKLALQQLDLQKEKDVLNQQLGILSGKQQHLYASKDSLHVWQQGETLVIKLLQQKEKKELQAKELQVKNEALLAVKQQLEEAQISYKYAKSDWATLQIQKLAEDLVEGEPCLVCGSKEHPVRVQQSTVQKTGVELELILEEKETQVTNCQTEIEVLLHTIQRLEDKSQQLEEKIQQLEQEWKLYAESLPITEKELHHQAEELQQFILELQQEIDGLSSELARRQEMELQYESIKGQLNQMQEINVETERKWQTALSQLENFKGRFDQLRQGIPKAYLDTQKYSEEVRNVQESIDEWEEALEKALQTHRDAEKTVEQSKYSLKLTRENIAEWKEKLESLGQKIGYQLEKSPFSTIEQIEQELRHKASVSQWRDEIVQFEKVLYTIQQNQLKMKEKLNGKPQPKVDEATEAYGTLVEERAQKTEEKVLLQEHYRQNDLVLSEGEKVLSEQKAAVQLYTQIAELSDVANGDTGVSKLGFERYVLSYYLEEVLQIANQRLQKLSDNRYWFDLNRESGSYKNKTGLEINIYDDHAGGVRNVGTLSGGESFIAALSLALSLSDVVQRQSGGIQIEAIFIDEGFGSLDEDALDKAVEALMQIDGDGKLVGIISHVKELKDRIPDKVLVKALGTGKSNLEVVHA